MRTLDWRRRKTTPCLDDIWQAELRGKGQGRPYDRLLVTQTQMNHICELARVQIWAAKPGPPRQLDALTFGKFRVEVR